MANFAILLPIEPYPFTKDTYGLPGSVIKRASMAKMAGYSSWKEMSSKMTLKERKRYWDQIQTKPGTGDQGYFDNEGYLKISGRLKEIINKGGEKISPLEVDNVLMDHPLIDQAVCFGYEDKMLGENIASAIIIKSGEACSENDVLEYAKEKLAKFKIPKKIFFVEEIPKGATGKSPYQTTFQSSSGMSFDHSGSNFTPKPGHWSDSQRTLPA